jgi:FkbM family methyltransferase
MSLNWKILGIAAASFALGFMVHRQQVQEPVRALVAYVTGNHGGCNLSDLLKANQRAATLSQSFDIAQRMVKVVEGTPDGFSRWETPLGPLWCPPRNSASYTIGEQLAEVYTEGPMALGPGDVVLDCGANIGGFVRMCLKAGVAKVVAIDPSPNNVEAMKRSFSEEIARGQVILVPKGVWHEDSTIKMFLYENSLLDSFVMPDRRENEGGPKPQEVELPVTTIDKIVEELNLDKITFVKMDIEGAERNAIRGAVKTIARFRPRLALATENLEDDYIVVPQEVQKLAQNYKTQCGLCRRAGRITYRPDILFFTPQ